ncbi:MAG: elongation factor P [Flavobacteriales bacterium]|nr:elongation factor P [Flavobacteriales bacterium]
MATTADLSRGLFIRHQGQLCRVVEYQHTMPGKGGAFYQVKMKNAITGKSSDYRFRSGESIDVVRVEEKEMQFLYMEGENLVVMDTESYEQFQLSAALVGDAMKFLKEEMMLTVYLDNGNPILADAPNHVVLEITYSEPGIKGDTANNPLKPATLETGAIVQVPLFVNQGEKIKVDTRTGEYVERAK